MDTLSKYRRVQWRATPRYLLFLASLTTACLSGAACQHGATNLDRTGYDRQIRDADGFLFESYNRYIVMQFTESAMDGLTDDDSIITYLSVPWSVRDGLDIGDPGIAVGWSSVAVVFSDMFEPKNSLRFDPLPHDKDDDREWNVDTARLLELTRERNTAPDPALIRELDAGRQLQIVDYGSLLVDDPKLLEIGSANREDRTTD